tara:strand:+ start:2149 stop:2388 length:240 start_codon:yes stop_codon:yes gene_type:complete
MNYIKYIETTKQGNDMIYQDFTKFEMNKEVTRISRLFDTNKYISQKEEDLLIIRMQELERKLNITIIISGIYNYHLEEL